MKQAKYIGLIILCAHILPLSSSSGEENPYILRLNYGIVATKLNKLCLVEGTVCHCFHIKLPTGEAADISVTVRPMNTSKECTSTCERMTALHQAMINLVNSMKTAARNLITKINSVVIDLEAETTSVFARKQIVKKGIVDGFRSFLKWFGGTATQDDLQELKTA
jgi:hypothetical protein